MMYPVSSSIIVTASSIDVADTHKGYFSIDKKTGRSINSALKRGSEFSDDISAYDLILKNKERLLSFDEPKRINHKYAYAVYFDSAELIEKSIKHIDSELFVSELTYTVSKGEQTAEMDANALERGEAFKSAKTRTTTLKRSEVSQIRYDLVGKIAEGTVLTRKTIVEIIKGISPLKFAMYRANPEEFITKVVRLINEQKATMIVEHISYDQIEGEYDSTIFTAEKTSSSIDKA